MATRARTFRRRPAQRRTPARSKLRYDRLLLVAALLAGAFVLGRRTATTIVPPDAVAELVSDSESDVAPTETKTLGTLTSTVGLCPCPKPRKKGSKMKPIGTKKTDKVVTPPFERADPTEATAAYLKRSAKRLSACAPAGGKRLRVHLQITIAPNGTVDGVQITNLDPIDPNVSTCVDQNVRSFTPPPFDATEPVTFALTAVL